MVEHVQFKSVCLPSSFCKWIILLSHPACVRWFFYFLAQDCPLEKPFEVSWGDSIDIRGKRSYLQITLWCRSQTRKCRGTTNKSIWFTMWSQFILLSLMSANLFCSFYCCFQAHPWFKDIVWDKLYDMEAAFKPAVNDELDTQNFLKFDEVWYSSIFVYLPNL